MPQWKPLHVHSGICLGKWKKNKMQLASDSSCPPPTPTHTHTHTHSVLLLLFLSILEIKNFSRVWVSGYSLRISVGTCAQNGSFSVWSLQCFALGKGKSFGTAARSICAISGYASSLHALLDANRGLKENFTKSHIDISLSNVSSPQRLLCGQTIHRRLKSLSIKLAFG